MGREDGGIYTCTAHNTLGVSGPREIVLDVECESDSPIVALFVAYKVRHFTNLNCTVLHCSDTDSPHIVSLEPSGTVTSLVGSRLSLACLAEANPRVPHGRTALFCVI